MKRRVLISTLVMLAVALLDVAPPAEANGNRGLAGVLRGEKPGSGGSGSTRTDDGSRQAPGAAPTGSRSPREGQPAPSGPRRLNMRLGEPPRSSDSTPDLPKDKLELPYQPFQGRPFIKGEGDTNEIDPNDPDQGGLGDCYLIASLMSVAKTDPELIRNMIDDNGDGTYTVHFKDIGPLYGDRSVKVSPTFPTWPNTTDAAFGSSRDVDGGQRELWPALIEKAFAQQQGGYDDIEGGWAKGPLSYISGKDTTSTATYFKTQEEIAAELDRAIAGDHPVVVSTLMSREDQNFLQKKLRRSLPDDIQDSLGIYASHAYSVQGRTKDGRYILRNPHGQNHPTRPLTSAEIQQYFSYVTVGEF